MKSLEELKAQVLDEAGCCGQCDLYHTTQDHPFGCPEAQAKILLVQELLEYTEQLESHLAQVERERDAAVKIIEDATTYLEDFGAVKFALMQLKKWNGVCEEHNS